MVCDEEMSMAYSDSMPMMAASVSLFAYCQYKAIVNIRRILHAQITKSSEHDFIF